MPHPIDWEKLVRIFAALLTPVIAVVTAYVAFQQYQTNRLQYRLKLFEKRMAVFSSVMNIIYLVGKEQNVELDQLQKMLRETELSQVLFGPEINEFIREVLDKG